MKQFLAFLESFVIVVLVLAGLVGLSYHVFRGGGWFDSAFEKVAEFVFLNVTVSIVVGLTALIVFVLWNERRLAKGMYGKRLPTIILYVFMAAGAFFIGRYALLGTL